MRISMRIFRAIPRENGVFDCETIFCVRFSPFEGEYREYATGKEAAGK